MLDSGQMAQAAFKYVFAVLLALLSTQAAMPSGRVVNAAAIVWYREAKQAVPAEVVPARAPQPAGPPAPVYRSRCRPVPDAFLLFQRPPPAISLFS